MKASVGFPVICLFLFTFTGLAVKAQLKADFSANTISGCAPLIVKFSDQSLGGPTQWKWDLGNGTISFLQNPSASYFNPGQYTIKLVIRSGASVDSVVKTQFINVSAKPQVEFTASATSGCFPLPVQFRDNSTPGSGNIVSWQWDFGDGISSAEQHPQHTYSSAGSFNVTLRVFNSTGCLTTVSKSQYIQINSGVKAGFENSVPNVCSPPVLINFQNTSVGTGPLTYAWNFGDGTVSGEVNPSHSYTSAGNYQVELVVTNVTGCRDTLVKPGAINVGAVRPAFSAADQVCAGAPLSFTNTSSPAPVSATWDFGDGSGSSETSAVKRYLLPGTFRVKMIANFGSCFDSVFQTITVLSKPVALFTVTDSTSCKAPFRVNFVNQSLDGMRFEWRFGDTITSLLPAPTHTFQTYGNYNVQLTATGSNGCQDSLVRTGFIRIIPPEAVLVNLPDSGCAPFTKTFSAGIVSVDPVTKYQWNFGDGSASSAISPTHSYTVPGVYTIRLVVTTAGGCTDTVIKQAGIVVTVKPVAKFVATPRDACATAGVKFIDESSGAPFRWRWEFGDGSISTLQNPSHAYTDTGYFDVQLIVWNTGCSDTVTYREYIHIKPPVARFSFLSNCTNPYERVFTDQSIGADDWEWDFGDGNTSTQQNPVHIYSSPGEYSVSLVVHNNTTGCDYTSRKRVHVVDIKPGFYAPDTAVCKGTNVNFTTNLSLTEVSRFNWDFGDGTIVDSITNSASHSYKLAGTYSVTLITTDILGCSDTVAKPMYMQVNGPTAGFTSSVPGTCQENTVFFNDQSTSDGTHALKSWSWNYADGHMETLPTPSGRHTYSNAGTYSVSLVVTDSEGCVDSTQLPSALVISKPAANFTTADTLGCQGKAITFTNQSVGPNLQYRWNFGDGTTTTEPHPAHTYTVDGTYT
jgi:PKD repeat protein